MIGLFGIFNLSFLVKFQVEEELFWAEKSIKFDREGVVNLTQLTV